MALMVEDGSGKSDAESYVSVADADTYHAAHSGSSDWSGADTADKEKALRLGTQWLDARYRERWRGTRYSGTQALDWPRYSVVIDDYILDPSELPQQLLDAACELALKKIEGDTLFPDMADEGVLVSKTVRVGPITSAKTYLGGTKGVKRYRLIEALVAVLIESHNQLERA